ncbi:6-phosphogluconate dehydrogenase (decarboxylating) [Loktanella fryxellensis]|uniref:6-phosphogluconate dehydrogenase, decarboxylating n=1 Tax=Loktanella fryxellensis TaxID=245187 RepID=A0A1H8FBQ0_9RHOB|nr:NADP-dependent phosphogluconate dehydrogenase [Loktanella fryxellensis]SEN29301.1 6-phosphogluconate dehydrogenase (decarboxylating) [Loktanella fryxellensis]
MTTSQIGLLGLGTMGAALALNIANKGFRIAVFNRTTQVTRDFAVQAGDLAARITPTEGLQDFVAALSRPRAIILMVPAGQAVDDQIAALTPLLDAGDLIIDAGNADFHDTNRRAAAAGDVRFMGIGVSGGEDGARHGPSIMAGGDRADWDRVAPILTAIAASHDGVPCATWMGPAGAGHFVKAVHNGIEYADMQMIAEVYGILRDGMGLDNAAIAKTFRTWNDGALASYLIEISGHVAAATDTLTGQPLLDIITDAAGQKGTGRWTAIEAQHLGAPVPVIEAAVAARNLSSRRDERAQGQAAFGAAPQAMGDALTATDLERALIAGKIICYAQGFAMIDAAARAFDWPLPLPDIAKVWRAGCIIRSVMLDDMATALARSDANLMLSAPFTDLLRDTHVTLRKVVAQAALHGLPVPALSSALAYFDTMRTHRGTANLLQGQRDFFGRHGFERLDRDGTDFHGPWAD